MFALTSNAYALNDNSYEAGRYWGFDDKPKKAESRKIRPQPAFPSNTAKPIRYAEVKAALSKELEEAKSKAILLQTEEAVLEYRIMQNKFVRLADQFSLNWEKAGLAHPRIDYANVQSTHNPSLALKRREELADEKVLIQNAASTYGLVFFYDGYRSQDVLFAKIIHSVAQAHGFELLGVIQPHSISTDSITRTVVDNGQSRLMHAEQTPALFLFDPRTSESRPISYAVLSESELQTRLYDVLTNFTRWDQ